MIPYTVNAKKLSLGEKDHQGQKKNHTCKSHRKVNGNTKIKLSQKRESTNIYKLANSIHLKIVGFLHSFSSNSNFGCRRIFFGGGGNDGLCSTGLRFDVS